MTRRGQRMSMSRKRTLEQDHESDEGELDLPACSHAASGLRLRFGFPNLKGQRGPLAVPVLAGEEPGALNMHGLDQPNTGTRKRQGNGALSVAARLQTNVGFAVQERHNLCVGERP